MARSSKKRRAREAPGRSPAAFSWYPPHMHRAHKRFLQEIKHAELIVEMRDARLPLGSANPELAQLSQGKRRLLIFNKASLASAAASKAWREHYSDRDTPALFLDVERRGSARRVLELAEKLTRPMGASFTRREIRPPPPRAMVIGIPNVGKSTLVNRLLRRKLLATGPQPGVTRASAWVPIKGHLAVLDTPGVLLPRIETEAEACRLGWIGALPQHLIGAERLAESLLEWLLAQNHHLFAAHYGLNLDRTAESPETAGVRVLADIAAARRLLTRHGEPDVARTAVLLLNDFREGKLGRLTIEWPDPP